MRIAGVWTLTLTTLHCAAAASEEPIIAGLETPPGCKVINGDRSFPNSSIWTRELPGVVPTVRKADPATSTDYTLVAWNAFDVQAAVRFASKHNVRLTVINSGSDFLGRNDAASGLWLAVGNLKGVRVSENFSPRPQGVPPLEYRAEPVSTANTIPRLSDGQAFVTFGAGVSAQELNDALNKSGLVTVGAASAGVKVAGGYGQTGGHGPLSSRFGLAADLIVEFKVVTADGNLQVANKRANPELFWALRGGGGGTFGVVIEATMKAFPTPKVTLTRWWIKTADANDTNAIFPTSAYILSKMPALNTKGVQGYFYIYPTSMWAMMLTYDSDAGIPRAKHLWEPILSVAEKFPGMQKTIYQYANFDDFKQFFDWRYQPLLPKQARSPSVPEGPKLRTGISMMDSRLLSAKHLGDQQLALALQGSMKPIKNSMLRGHLVGGGQVMNADRRDRADNAVLPAWRDAYVHLIATGVGGPSAAGLKLLAPDSGCYANECSYQESTFKTTMWGRNYDRLYRIKQYYDPNGLFWVSPGVGADDFEYRNGRVCRISSSNLAPGGRNSTMAYGFGSHGPSTVNPWGHSSVSDNNNFQHDQSVAYSAFPETQEQADREGPKVGTWG